MHEYTPLELLLDSPKHKQGLTLVELLVSLVILSILAASALPYAELTIRRDHELDLRRALREIRTAIDYFHQDWEKGKISKFGGDASEDGYPKTLQVLVDGVEYKTAKGGKRRYLRRIPRGPFSDKNLQPEESWLLRSYQDESDVMTWGGQDVYDVYSASERKAIDGTLYKDW